MTTLFIVFAAIAAVALMAGFIWNGMKKKHVVNFFRGGNVIVAGHKGNGKDLLFSMVIKERDKAGEPHAANIRYTDKTKVRPPRDYCLKNTTMKNFIAGNFDSEQQTFNHGEDYYISEAGLSLPNWLRGELERDDNTKTLPITFALSRHLAEFNIHSNAQEFIRVWDKLREQADIMIYCEKAKVYGHRLAFQKFVVYDRLQSAMDHVQPIKIPRGLFGKKRKEALGHVAVFNAKYGYIERFKIWHVLPKKPYDTRAFYRALYKKDPPKIDKRKKRPRKKDGEKSIDK